jgi:hypothetical protein
MSISFRSERIASSSPASRVTVIATAVALLSIAACRDASGPDKPILTRAQAPSTTLAAVSQDETPDQLAVAQVVPGFGGYFLDGAGRPTVYLTDPAQRATAENALSAFLASRDFSAADLQVLQADYSYVQLDAWYRQARNGAFSVAGIVLGDVDEAKNRIRFGVTTAVAVAGVGSVVSGLSIPASAVIVEQRAAIKPVATLRERVRPVIGGLQINFFVSPVSAVTYLCTLGFNAIKDGVASFITNSHCSNVEGGTDTPTDYYQHLRGASASNGFTPIAANFIGVEADDPPWNFQTNVDCPPPLGCRYSDALRARYNAGAEFTLGRIARVDEITTSLDDTLHTIAGYWTIKGKQQNSVVGETANKTGRTTGWTVGPTTETCVDVLALETNHIRLCQTLVKALVDGGDSGSNVWRRKGNSTGVVLMGILWGGSVDEANPEFVYSPMSGIERELGTLKVN